MKPRNLLIAVLAPAVLAACASQSLRERQAEALARHLDFAGTPVESFAYLGRYDGWRALGDDELVVYTTPSQGYLLSVAPPCRDLQFANRIAIDSTGSIVRARFDSVLVDGFRCQITQIRPVDYGAMKRAAREEGGYRG